MLRLDANRFIKTIYYKSIELNELKDSGYIAEIKEEEDDKNEDDRRDRLEISSRTEAQ